MDDAETLFSDRTPSTRSVQSKSRARRVEGNGPAQRHLDSRRGSGAHDPVLILAAVAFAQSKVDRYDGGPSPKHREDSPRVRLRTEVDAVSVPTSVGHGSIGSETRGKFLGIPTPEQKSKPKVTHRVWEVVTSQSQNGRRLQLRRVCVISVTGEYKRIPDKDTVERGVRPRFLRCPNWRRAKQSVDGWI